MLLSGNHLQVCSLMEELLTFGGAGFAALSYLSDKSTAMKIVLMLFLLTGTASGAYSQEDSIKTSHEKFYQPITKIEVPDEVMMKKEVSKPSSEEALKAKVDTRKVQRKKTVARKDY
ncbi:MAG: hypothetical protein EOO00_08075 [Chitinophagaceae bacterium]|nr:MAG: hypothetical protein EOO00_08075 [Chitinophagaceae bacterium]